jgi:Raf kinase inhibitor-like YbhB/YbcL family protein
MNFFFSLMLILFPLLSQSAEAQIQGEKKMQLKSSAFENGKRIPKKYSCEGEDISPPLEISGVPENAKSLVLIVEDPDVPERIRRDRLYVHWVLYDIDPATKKIDEGKKVGTLGKTTGGKLNYQGPCPPDREHRYFFKLFALDTKLNFPGGKTREEILKAMEGHIVAQTELLGLYEKSSKS